jgi:hypothetical protein
VGQNLSRLGLTRGPFFGHFRVARARGRTLRPGEIHNTLGSGRPESVLAPGTPVSHRNSTTSTPTGCQPGRTQPRSSLRHAKRTTARVCSARAHFSRSRSLSTARFLSPPSAERRCRHSCDRRERRVECQIQKIPELRLTALPCPQNGLATA